MDDSDWERLVRQLRAGRCTPFIGAGACHGTLPTGRALAHHWADEYDYPFADRDNLPRVMQYAASRVGDPVDLKEMVVDFLRDHGRPARIADEPHRTLARLPIPIYLTTNYDDFMVDALLAANKAPTTVVCRWHENRQNWPDGSTDDDLEPQAETPVVFHMHGAATEPASLVLTEQDYLDFLINLAADQGADDKRLIPTSVLPALTKRPLLFVGYSLQDWTFRVIFQGLQRAIPPGQRRRHVSVQLPELHDPAAEERVLKFLNKSFENWNIAIYWGTAANFFAELNRRLALP